MDSTCTRRCSQPQRWSSGSARRRDHSQPRAWLRAATYRERLARSRLERSVEPLIGHASRKPSRLKKRKSRRGVKIVGNHTGFGGPRGGRWITAEGFSSSPIFGESFGRPVWIFSADRPNLIICNHSFLTLQYSTKVHNLRFSHATSSRASPMEL
jgi:hypothetical protein